MGKLSLVSAIALVLAVMGGVTSSCTTEEGSTPTCAEDVSKGYPDRSVATGCNRFAGCYDANGNAQPAENCCVDPMGMALVGVDLQLCLYGYGAANPPLPTGAGGGGGAGGGTGGATTSTTTTTTGSAGGGGGAGGGASGGGGTGGSIRTGATMSALGGVLLSVAYDGGPFAGFAPQPSQRTIAGELLGALRALDPNVKEVRGVSRTDAGVHARDQRVAFDTETSIPPRGWVLGATRHLPREIAIRRAARVPAGFTPRFQSVSKRYRYLLLDDVARDPFLDGRAWRLEGASAPAALARARAEAALAVGTHDYAAFRSSADERTNTVRTIRSLEVEQDPADRRLVAISVHGDAFLHNMVRILAGTLVDVARERLAPGAFARALASRDRRDLGITAPPDGLYLEHVELTDDGADAWP